MEPVDRDFVKLEVIFFERKGDRKRRRKKACRIFVIFSIFKGGRAASKFVQKREK